MTITKSRVYIVYLGGLWHLIADGRDVATYEQRGPAEAGIAVELRRLLKRDASRRD